MTTFSRLPDVVTARVDDDLVLLNPSTEVFFRLNETAERIWDLLATPATQEALVQSLLEEYQVDEQQCATAVAAFLRDAEGHGVIDVS